MVTLTLRLLITNVPSLSSAMAITSWVRARRARLETAALPDCGVKWKLATPGCGLAVAMMWIVLTYSLSVIGLLRETVNGTVLPFSAISGISSMVLTSAGLA